MKNFKFIFYLFLINNIFSTSNSKKSSLFNKIVNKFIENDFNAFLNFNILYEKIKTPNNLSSKKAEINNINFNSLQKFLLNKYKIQNYKLNYQNEINSYYQQNNKNYKNFETLFKNESFFPLNSLFAYQQIKMNLKK